MVFSEHFLSNKVYCDQPLMFNPLLKEKKGGLSGKEEMNTGVFPQANGDLIFRLYAPNAGTIHVAIKGQSGCKRGCDLVQNEEGIFEGVLPYDPTFCGPHSIDIEVDETVWLCPYIPIMWHRNKPVNFIEIPDPDTTYININDVPHGAIAREIYWSKELKTWQRCMVYTPPGYHKNTEEYPVLYLQHGATENETCWAYNGRVGYILDNLLAEGKCKPFIVVMNDGMARHPEDGDVRAGNHSAFEKSLLESCIPFIESNYRVKTDKWNRAMAGLSMGSMQTVLFGFTHPELFGYLGIFSGLLFKSSGAQALKPKVLDPEFMASNYKVVMRSIGDAEGGYEDFLAEDGLLKEAGVFDLPLYTSCTYKYQTHEWGAWRRSIYDFAQLIFKE